jgi:hypothetical protein
MLRAFIRSDGNLLKTQLTKLRETFGESLLLINLDECEKDCFNYTYNEKASLVFLPFYSIDVLGTG